MPQCAIFSYVLLFFYLFRSGVEQYKTVFAQSSQQKSIGGRKENHVYRVTLSSTCSAVTGVTETKHEIHVCRKYTNYAINVLKGLCENRGREGIQRKRERKQKRKKKHSHKQEDKIEKSKCLFIFV